MTIKPSEYYRGIEDVEGRASAHVFDARRLVNWFVDILEHGRRLRDAADAHGLPADAQEQLDGYRKMLEDGPPDGEGYMLPPNAEWFKEPAFREAFNAPRRTRTPCAECGSMGKHKATCSLRSKPAIQERNEQDRAKDGERISLAGRIRALEGWREMLPSDVAARLEVPLSEVSAAWPLLTGEKAP